MVSQGFENVPKIEINFHKEKHWFKLQTMNMLYIYIYIYIYCIIFENGF